MINLQVHQICLPLPLLSMLPALFLLASCGGGSGGDNSNSNVIDQPDLPAMTLESVTISGTTTRPAEVMVNDAADVDGMNNMSFSAPIALDAQSATVDDNGVTTWRIHITATDGGDTDDHIISVSMTK